MRKALVSLALLAAFVAAPVAAQDANMSFFITSAGPGNGANLGGLTGADSHCQDIAYAAGAGDLEWRAYLSAVAMGGQAAVNARDRIGEGPWYNFNGDLIARDPDHLHSNGAQMFKSFILTEKGEEVNGRGDSPNQHDILTGSNMDGTVFTADGDTTCRNWTSGGEGGARVGHHDRQGGGQNPPSWNSAHTSRGCSQDALIGTGGNGYFYCFATNGPGQQQPLPEW